MLGRVAFVLTLSIVGGCTPAIPEGRLSCSSGADCPDGWACRDDHCYRAGTDGGPGLDAPSTIDAAVTDSPGPACVMSEDCPADDGLLCTVAPECTGGRCVYALRAGTCLIAGVCYGEGEHLGERTGATDPCLVCDPASPNEFSPDVDAPCGTGAFCALPGACSTVGTCLRGNVCPFGCDEAADTCLCESESDCPIELPPGPCAPPPGECTATRVVTSDPLCDMFGICGYTPTDEPCSLPLRARCGDDSYTCPDGSIVPTQCRICLGSPTPTCEVDEMLYNLTCLPRCVEIGRLCGAGTAIDCAASECPPDSALVLAADTDVCCLGATRCGP